MSAQPAGGARTKAPAAAGGSMMEAKACRRDKDEYWPASVWRYRSHQQEHQHGATGDLVQWYGILVRAFCL
jgi:hypothetical protein